MSVVNVVSANACVLLALMTGLCNAAHVDVNKATAEVLKVVLVSDFCKRMSRC